MQEAQTLRKPRAKELGLLQRFSLETLQISGLALAVVVFAIIVQLNFPVFLSLPNVNVMITNFLPEAIIALGMTIVIITAGIDLSVAGIYPFSAIVGGLAAAGGLADTAGYRHDLGGGGAHSAR